jgi:hypothetical protein
MSNFPQVGADHLRRMRAQLLTSQSDPVWAGTVTQLLHMLIDNDLASHRTAELAEHEHEHEPSDAKPWVEPKPLEQIEPESEQDPNPFARLSHAAQSRGPKPDIFDRP